MKCPNMVHDFSLQGAHLFLPSFKSVSYGISLLSKHQAHGPQIKADDNLQTKNTCQKRERKKPREAMHLFFMNVENASKVKRAFFTTTTDLNFSVPKSEKWPGKLTNHNLQSN